MSALPKGYPNGPGEGHTRLFQSLFTSQYHAQQAKERLFEFKSNDGNLFIAELPKHASADQVSAMVSQAKTALAADHTTQIEVKGKHPAIEQCREMIRSSTHQPSQ